MPRTNDIATAFEHRRGTVERIENAQAQYFVVTGEVEVVGTGEASADLLFPCYFVGKPRLFPTHELSPGQPFVAGQMPTASMTVLDWSSSIQDDNTVLYMGARVGFVTTGPTGQSMLIQWHADGPALRGPIPDPT